MGDRSGVGTCLTLIDITYKLLLLWAIRVCIFVAYAVLIAASFVGGFIEGKSE